MTPCPQCVHIPAITLSFLPSARSPKYVDTRDHPVVSSDFQPRDRLSAAILSSLTPTLLPSALFPCLSPLPLPQPSSLASALFPCQHHMRTKQTAKKSTGGRAKRAILQSGRVLCSQSSQPQGTSRSLQVAPDVEMAEELASDLGSPAIPLPTGEPMGFGGPIPASVVLPAEEPLPNLGMPDGDDDTDNVSNSTISLKHWLLLTHASGATSAPMGVVPSPSATNVGVPPAKGASQASAPSQLGSWMSIPLSASGASRKASASM